MNNNLEQKLKDIDEEDIIWLIFIGIFILRIYSNKVEREYRINNKLDCRKKYHKINEFTYIIAIVIALYYIYRNWNTENRNISLITNGLSIIVLVIFYYLEETSND